MSLSPNYNPNLCCIVLVESPSLTSSLQWVLACFSLIECAWGFGLFWSYVWVCESVCPWIALDLYYGCGLANIHSLLICKHTPPPSRSSESRCPHIRKRSDLIASPRATLESRGWTRREREREKERWTGKNRKQHAATPRHQRWVTICCLSCESGWRWTLWLGSLTANKESSWGQALDLELMRGKEKERRYAWIRIRTWCLSEHF